MKRTLTLILLHQWKLANTVRKFPCPGRIVPHLTRQIDQFKNIKIKVTSNTTAGCVISEVMMS